MSFMQQIGPFLPYIAMGIFGLIVVILLYVFRCKIPIWGPILCAMDNAKKDGETCNLPTDCKSNLDPKNGGNCCLGSAGKNVCIPGSKMAGGFCPGAPAGAPCKGSMDCYDNLDGRNGNCCGGTCKTAEQMTKIGGVYCCPDDQTCIDIFEIVEDVGDVIEDVGEVIEETVEDIGTILSGEANETCKSEYGSASFDDPDGNCYTCPSPRSDRVAITSVTGSEACVYPDSSLVGMQDISSRPFKDLNKNIYRCPFHFRRTADSVTTGTACKIYPDVGGIHGDRTDHLNLGLPGTNGGTFSGVDMDRLWKCPDGYGRGPGHIQSTDACSSGNNRKSAILLRSHGAPMKNIITGHTFFATRNSDGSNTDFWKQYFGRDTGVTNDGGWHRASAMYVNKEFGSARLDGNWNEGFRNSKALLAMDF